MSIKIIVTDTGLYVNHRLKCLKAKSKELCVIKLEPDTEDIDSTSKIIDVSADKAYMDLEKARYESWQFHCIQNHASEIVDLFTITYNEKTWFEDILILGDINMDALYVLDVFQKSDYTAHIHLVLPIPFGRTVKGTVQNEILSNLNKVRTLAIYDPYKIATEKYGNTKTETIEKVISEQTKHICDNFDTLRDKMSYQLDSTKYFYDFEKNSYVDTETLYVLDDYEITHTLGLVIDPYLLCKDKEENDYVIECFIKPVPRPDGKIICEKLRVIRKEFARLNCIDYKFRECTYNGPCAGTCKACDEEAKELCKIAKKLGNVKYPDVILEELL